MFASVDFKAYLFRPVVAQGLCVLWALLIVVQWISLGMQFWQGSKSSLSQEMSVALDSPYLAEQETLKLTWPLFGEYVPKQFGSVGIKQSKLDLDVVGVLYSPRENESQVIIRSPGGEEKTFNLGDTLPGGAVIKKISADGILVMYHAELERLSLPKRSLIFEPPPKRALFSH